MTDPTNLPVLAKTEITELHKYCLVCPFWNDYEFVGDFWLRPVSHHALANSSNVSAIVNSRVVSTLQLHFKITKHESHALAFGLVFVREGLLYVDPSTKHRRYFSL